jgi:hypothetical protein
MASNASTVPPESHVDIYDKDLEYRNVNSNLDTVSITSLLDLTYLCKYMCFVAIL